MDFDIIGKDGKSWKKYDNAEKLFDEFRNFGENGIWKSGTDGNFGCLVKLEDDALIKRIEESGIDKTEVDNVEILFNTNFILPPSPSVCKKTKKIRRRELLVPGTLLLNPNEEQLAFIKQLITNVKPAKKNKIPAASNTKDDPIEMATTRPTPKKEVIDKFWDYANILDKKYIEKFDNWFKFACMHYNILGAANYEQFDDFCKKFDGYNEDENKTKYNSINPNSDRKIGWRTLYEWAKDSDPDLKQKVDNKYIEKCFDKFKMHNLDAEDVKKIKEEYKKAMKEIGELHKSEKKKIEEKTVMLKENLTDDYNKRLKKKQQYFEKYHMKIMNPFCFLREAYDDITLYAPNKFAKLNEEVTIYNLLSISKQLDWTSVWRKKLDIRTFETYDFRPYPTNCPWYIYNLFKGLRADTLFTSEEKDYQPILDHLKILTGHNEAAYEYNLNYIAHIVQKPGEKPKVALVYISEQGVGKNIFWEELMENLLGYSYYFQTDKQENFFVDLILLLVIN